MANDKPIEEEVTGPVQVTKMPAMPPVEVTVTKNSQVVDEEGNLHEEGDKVSLDGPTAFHLASLGHVTI